MKLPQSFKLFLLAIMVCLLTASCANGKKIPYFQGLDEIIQSGNSEDGNLIIKPNDLLTISVSAFNMEAAAPYNLPVVGVAAGGGMDAQLRVSGTPQLQPYLVDSEGNIDFPQLGSINVAGMNRHQLVNKLKADLADFVKDPIVIVRIVNFQVSVLGEVNRPGTFSIQDEYLSIPKALGLAGDLTIYGLRDNVLVMREQNGQKVHAYLDLSDANVVNSPFYYLQQNDVVYVEPNNVQKQGAAYNRNASVYISIASVLISLAILITR